MTIALILSGGTGSRMGSDTPKQYLSAGGEMMITCTLRKFYCHRDIDGVQIVAAAPWHERINLDQQRIFRYQDKFKGFSVPGENRQLSILHGLRDIAEYADAGCAVVVHDAARPLVTEETIGAGLLAMEGHDGAMPVLPMKDTVYLSKDGQKVSSLVDRREVVAGQAPEFFYLGKYLAANEALSQDEILNINGATEPAVMAGMDIRLFAGDEGNFKVTTPGDWDRYCRIMERL